MFSDQKKSRLNPEPNKEQNKIASGTVITGNISGKGSFRIEGTLEGNLKTPGKVVVSKAGVIHGDLECENADIEGKFTGKLKVNGVLSLRGSAVVDGEIVAGKLAIEEGASFNATCEMAGGIKSLSDERSKQQREEKSA